MTPPLELDEAQARLLQLATPVGIERIPAGEASGRFLAATLHARRTQPPADLSAMDGYAVRAEDMPGPWQVIGESACGHPFGGALSAGQAVRISTGALLPQGGDRVLLQEDCQRDGAGLALSADPGTARNIRVKGNDFAEGDALLVEGTRLGAAQLGLAISGGHRLLPVRRKVRVTMIDTGDELAADPEHCAPHQIPASNGAMLSAMAAALPTEVTHGPPVPDRLDALVKALSAARGADLIVSSGGVSVGDHDLLQPALGHWGAEIDFWRVSIKPGKPLLVARKGSTIVLGLPGNPVSSHVTAYLFMLPLIRALSGAVRQLPLGFRAKLAKDLPPGGTRREFIRGYWDGTAITPLTNQDSGALATLAASNALIERPANAPVAPAGSTIQAYLLENGGIA